MNSNYRESAAPAETEQDIIKSSAVNCIITMVDGSVYFETKWFKHDEDSKEKIEEKIKRRDEKVLQEHVKKYPDSLSRKRPCYRHPYSCYDEAYSLFKEDFCKSLRNEYILFKPDLIINCKLIKQVEFIELHSPNKKADTDWE